MYKIYVHQSIEQGLSNIEKGEVILREDLKDSTAWVREQRKKQWGK